MRKEGEECEVCIFFHHAQARIRTREEKESMREGRTIRRERERERGGGRERTILSPLFF